MDNNQTLYNLPTPSIDMQQTMGGVSEASRLAREVMSTEFPTGLDGNLMQKMKEVSEMKLTSFDALYTPQFNGGGNGGFGTTQNGGVSMFARNTTGGMSWEGDLVDMDKYFTRMDSSVANMDKGAGTFIAVGAGTGALTGAGIGFTVGGPVGAAVGAVVGGVLGGLQGAEAGENAGYGYVRNKFGVNENIEREKQGYSGRAYAGLMNVVHSANKITMETFATVGNLPRAIAEKDASIIYNNDFSKAIDSYDKSFQASNKVYHSDAYKNASVLGSFLHTEHWAETVAPGIGFMVGAIGVGGSVSKGLGALGLAGKTGAASRAALSQTIKAGVKGETSALGGRALLKTFSQVVKNDLKAQTVKSLTNASVSLITSAVPEASIESRGAFNEAQENYINSYRNIYGTDPTAEEFNEFNKQNLKGANYVMAANVALVGSSNLLQFGDLLGLDKVLKTGLTKRITDGIFGTGIKKTLSEIGEDGIQRTVYEAAKRSRLQKVGYHLFKAGEAPITEGLWEEGMQSVISGTHNNYLESKFNPAGTSMNKSIIDAFGEAMAHTYGSEEGWREISVGMLVGGIGSARIKGGVDILGQREALNTIKERNFNVSNLNATQKNLEDTIAENYLANQAAYNNLNNSKVKNFADRLGAMNQQVVNIDRSKNELDGGRIEQARLSYQNALFAKFAAERRAGLTGKNKFDMEMMLENIPDDVAEQVTGFTNQDQIDNFKRETLEGYKNSLETFETAYELAENLNITKGTEMFSPQQVEEQAALHIFHGMQSYDNGTAIAKSIEDFIGQGGIADSINYYSNLDLVNQGRMDEKKSLQEKLAELREKENELMGKFSTAVVKPVRETENTNVVSQLDKVNNQMSALESEISQVTSKLEEIDAILSSKENMPQLPFGDLGTKFFDGKNIGLTDIDAVAAFESLQTFNRYIDHLNNTAEKSEEQIAIDKEKATRLADLVGMYQAQMNLMRNFAKTAQMVTDPAYLNGVTKGLFNRKKYDEEFDSRDWIENNKVGFTDMEKAEYQMLKDKVSSGEISKYDLHTFATNHSIMAMSVQENPLGRDAVVESKANELISEEDLDSIILTDENGGTTLDTKGPIFNNLIEDIISAVVNGQKLSPRQQVIYDIISKKDTEDTVDLMNRIEREKADREASPTTLSEPGRNAKLAQEQRLRQNAQVEIDKANNEFEAEVEAIRDEALLSEDTSELSEELENRLEEATQKRDAILNEIENRIQNALEYKGTGKNAEIHKTLEKLNQFVDSLIDTLKEANNKVNTKTIDEFNATPKQMEDIFNEFNDLAKKGNLTEQEEQRVVDLKEMMDNFGLIEGRLSDEDNLPVRLSDVLETRANLEREIFSDIEDFTQLAPQEINKVTTDSPTDDFSFSGRGGDPSVLNNYDFATFAGNDSDTIKISNITPGYLARALSGNTDFTITYEGSEFGLDDINSMVEPNSTVLISFTDSAGQSQQVVVGVDKSKRLIIPLDMLPTIQENSSLRFSSDNVIGKTGHHVLTHDINGVQEPVKTDFDLGYLVDNDAAQNLNPGDQISFEVSMEAEYNKELLPGLTSSTTGMSDTETQTVLDNIQRLKKYENQLIFTGMIKDVDIPNAEKALKDMKDRYENIYEEDKKAAKNLKKYNQEVVFPLLEAIEIQEKIVEDFKEMHKNAKLEAKAMRAELNSILGKGRSISKEIEFLEKRLQGPKLTKAQQTEQDEKRKFFKDNMVIVAKNKAGKIVGVVKSLDNSSGKNAISMDHLRSSLFDTFEKSGYKSAKSTFTTPVNIVYMGIPNTKVTGEGRVQYTFSDNPGDGQVNVNKILDVGYVTYGKVGLSSGSKLSTPYNYAHSILKDKTYQDRKVPVVVFKHNGKDVIYPITLKPNKDSNVVAEEFLNLTSKDYTTTSEKLSTINEFLASNNVNSAFRVTPLNYTQENLQMIEQEIRNSDFFSSVDEFLNNGNQRMNLMDNAFIDINIGDRPFIGPKIKFNIGSTPEFTSDLSREIKVVEESSELTPKIEENQEKTNCKIELD